MVPLVEQRLDAIRDLCRKHGVRTLVLFGSASRGDDFDPENSDVDFYVEFEPMPRGGKYLDLLVELERELGRPVDLVCNPQFPVTMSRIPSARPEVLYAA